MSLSGVLGTALSGMNAADSQLNSAASNIANLDTPGYRAQRPDLVELSSQNGVDVSGYSQDDAPGVDLPTELVATSQSRVLYNANAAVVRTADQMLGTLLDVTASDSDRSDRR